MSAPQTLNRTLGVTSATLLGIGAIFGTGVFVSIGIAAGLVGVWVLPAILVAALLATCNALSSAQLAAAHPVSGGTYEYGYRYLTPAFGFCAGWVFLLAKSASAATGAIGVAAYGLYLLAPEVQGLTGWVAAGISLAMTALVLTGLRRSNWLNTALVMVTLLGLVALILVALRAGDDAGSQRMSGLFAAEGFAFRSFAYASALMFVAYTGYGRIATMGEEIKHPARNIPRAIIATLVVSALVYGLVALSLILTIDPASLTEGGKLTARPLDQVAAALGPRWLTLLISVSAVTAMLGVLLNLILGLSRVALAMARRGDLPAPRAGLSAGGNPNLSVLLVGLFITSLTLVGNIETIWSFSAVTVLLYYAITNLAALRLAPEHRRFPRAISVAGLIACLSLAAFIPPGIWLISVCLILLGFACRFLLKALP